MQAITMIRTPATMPSIDRCAEMKRARIDVAELSATKTREKPATKGSTETRMRDRRSGRSPDTSVTETPAI
jgi:hypothetical protein